MVSLINQLSAYRLVLSNGIVIVVIVVCVSVLGYVMSSSLASCIHRLNNINQNNKIIYYVDLKTYFLNNTPHLSNFKHGSRYRIKSTT